MRFLSVRELRTQGAMLQRAVSAENITLTSNGKPFALMLGLGEGDDPAELERIVRKARAEWALSKIRTRAERNGTSKLSMEEIDREIAAARAAR
jgi:antitoxin (DNA-binding transcriptional repressor) of toxin-antitoxin stability system